MRQFVTLRRCRFNGPRWLDKVEIRHCVGGFRSFLSRDLDLSLGLNVVAFTVPAGTALALGLLAVAFLPVYTRALKISSIERWFLAEWSQVLTGIVDRPGPLSSQSLGGTPSSLCALWALALLTLIPARSVLESVL